MSTVHSGRRKVSLLYSYIVRYSTGTISQPGLSIQHGSTIRGNYNITGSLRNEVSPSLEVPAVNTDILSNNVLNSTNIGSIPAPKGKTSKLDAK